LRDRSVCKDLALGIMDNLSNVWDSTSIAKVVKQKRSLNIGSSNFSPNPMTSDKIFLCVLAFEKDTFVPRRHWNTMRKNENCDRFALF